MLTRLDQQDFEEFIYKMPIRLLDVCTLDRNMTDGDVHTGALWQRSRNYQIFVIFCSKS